MTVLPGIVVNGILYFCLEALSSLVRVGSSDSLTSIALPSRITNVVAGFQVDRYGAIVRKVTTLPRRAGRAKVQDVIDEKSPDGNRVSKRALELDRKDARFLGLEYGAGLLPMILGRTRIRLPAFLRNHLNKIDYAKAEVTLLP